MNNKRQKAAQDKRSKKRSETLNRFRDWFYKITSKIKFSALLENKRLLRIISVIIAFVIWTSVSTGAAVIESKTIKDVPIDFDYGGSLLSDYALRLVDSDIDTVDVVVQGPRYVIASMSADNIKVKAVTGGVNGAGEYTMALRADIDGSYTNTTVQLKSIETVTASYDIYSTDVLELEAVASTETVFADDSLTAVVTVNPGQVTVSGPSSVISKIARAVVYYSTGDAPLTGDMSVSSAISLLDSEGNRIISRNITANIAVASVNVKVEMIKTVDIGLTLYNAPEGYFDEFVTLSPSSVRIQGDPSVVEITNRLLVYGSIDISALTDSYTATLPLVFSDDSGSSILNNIDGVNTVKVSVDYSKVKNKTVDIKQFVIEGVGNVEGYTFTVAESVLENVVIYGKSAALANSSAGNLVGVVTVDPGNFTTGATKYTVRVVSETGRLVWSVGSYSVTVNVTKN